MICFHCSSIDLKFNKITAVLFLKGQSHIVFIRLQKLGVRTCSHDIMTSFGARAETPKMLQIKQTKLPKRWLLTSHQNVCVWFLINSKIEVTVQKKYRCKCSIYLTACSPCLMRKGSKWAKQVYTSLKQATNPYQCVNYFNDKLN